MSDGISLNLMDHCLRAVALLQVAYCTQPQVVDVVGNTTIGEIPEPLDKKVCCFGSDSRPQLLVCLKESGEPEDPNFQSNYNPNSALMFVFAPAVKTIKNTPATLVRFTEQNISCQTPLDTGNGNEKYVHEVPNWRSFGIVHTPGSSYAGIHLTEAKKMEMWYWALKMRQQSWSIIPAILGSAQEMGYKYWILPNGIKVPLNQVKLMQLDVVPNHVVLFEKVTKSGEATCKSIIPFDFSRVPPSLGMCQWHAVIEATLPTGEKYIVDPTSMQYNYKGAAGSLIAHGLWDQYVEEFPGTVFKIEGCSGGDISLIIEIKNQLITCKSRTFCAYCGLVEGKFEPRPHSSCRFETLNLMKCGRCKLVAYCNQLCQKAHWKQHKPNCAYVPN